jgi:hypothetical protein
VHALDYDEAETGVSREIFVKAVKAELAPTALREHEGLLMGEGYTKPLYLAPMYREMIGYGAVQCPFLCPHYGGKAEYRIGLCPVAENAYFTRVIAHELMRPPMSKGDIDDVAAAFHKVAENVKALSDRAHLLG